MMLSTLIITAVATFAPQENLQRQAHTFLLEESWQEAADALDTLAVETGDAEIMYDRGVAHYHLGDFATAATAFENAMASSNDETLRTHSAFNYGNAVFQNTMQELEGTGTASSTDEALIALEKAKEQIKKTLKSYRIAIAEDRSDMDARANGEFAWQMLTQLDQMQEQMEEQQEQQQQQDEQEQKQDDESADEQEQKQQNKDEGDSEQDQQQQDGEQSEEQQQQDGEQSEEQQQQDGEQSEEQQQQDGEQSKEQQQQDGEQSKEQQQQDGEQSENATSTEDPQKQQDLSEGELESAQPEQTQEQSKNDETEFPQPSEKEEGNRLSKDEANRLLQLIRDKEQQRRRALAAKRAAQRVPVEKDW